MGTSVDVLVGATGVVYGGATASVTLPTNATGSLDTDLKDLGFVSADGVTMSVNQDTTEIKAWGGSTIRKIQTGHTVEFHFVLLETQINSLGAYFGSANVDDPTNVAKVTASMNQRQTWVIEVVDGANIIRIVIPDGEVTGHDDVTYKTDEAIGYGVTVTAYEDSAGVKAYEYMQAAGLS